MKFKLLAHLSNSFMSHQREKNLFNSFYCLTPSYFPLTTACDKNSHSIKNYRFHFLRTVIRVGKLNGYMHTKFMCNINLREVFSQSYSCCIFMGKLFSLFDLTTTAFLEHKLTSIFHLKIF